jgi:hypothetical protein
MLVVGRAGVGGFGQLDVGTQVHGDGPVGVNEGDVPRNHDRDLPEPFDGLRHGLAGFQEIAQHDVHREARPGQRAPAEGQRDRQPCVVHAIQQPPADFLHADDPAQVVGADDGGFAFVRREVVVAQQPAVAGGLGAAGEERPEGGHREEGPGCRPVHLPCEAVQQRHQLRHVFLEQLSGSQRAFRGSPVVGQPALGLRKQRAQVGGPPPVAAIAHVDGSEGLPYLAHDPVLRLAVHRVGTT